MTNHAQNFGKRIASLKMRIHTLSDLRKIVSMPVAQDLTERQWSALERQLARVQEEILGRLKRESGPYLPRIYQPAAMRRLNTLLGEIELDMARAFTFFDTYMDVLTQRLTPAIGPALAGCDVLAWDALRRDHPALELVEPPLVFCERGFGAAILREEIRLPGGTPNPLPLIQIPYARLKEKYNLTSILHEAGHQAMVRLGLISALPQALRRALTRAGVPESIKDLFALWASEIGPDFWGFCACGAAQAASVKEILALPAAHVFRLSWTDPHPPPFIRVLLAFELCRQVWGRGEWDGWEDEWLALYPLATAPVETRRLHKTARTCLPVVARTLLNTRFRALGRKTIADLFRLPAVEPGTLRRVASTAGSGTLNLKGLAPCTQLAVFRVIRDQGKLSSDVLDERMTHWLIMLGKTRSAQS